MADGGGYGRAHRHAADGGLRWRKSTEEEWTSKKSVCIPVARVLFFRLPPSPDLTVARSTTAIAIRAPPWFQPLLAAASVAPSQCHCPPRHRSSEKKPGHPSVAAVRRRKVVTAVDPELAAAATSVPRRLFAHETAISKP
uniref:Uncharacterized protein n=1 Tax=Oryza sativa subsp. japonica TaxID=39947 RepID=Q75KD4_ORYSJ|nr:hypothetical protein [Oryza sativa Japonica Group]